MSVHKFESKLSDEAREAISSAFDAVGEWHKELASNSEKVTSKIAAAARVLGWPDHVVSAITAQVQSMTQFQIHMLSHILDAWQEQIRSPNPMASFPSIMMSKLQSWPGLKATPGWPSLQTFGDRPDNPVQFWVKIGEQWQKNWAQAMTAWAELGMPKR